MASDAPVSLRSATGVTARAPRRALPSARLVTVAQKARGTIHLWFSRRQDNGQCAALFYKKSEYGLSDASQAAGWRMPIGGWGSYKGKPKSRFRGERQPRTPGWPTHPPGGHRRQADR
jgi:hypothetical protein